MRRLVTAIGITALLCSAPGLGRASGSGDMGGSMGGSSSPSSSSRAAKSPDALGRERYEQGLQHREKALGLERSAASAADEKQRATALAQAKREWSAAVEQYRSALTKKSDSPEAYNELGYAQRKLGNYTESLAAYEQALALRPQYPRALEYLGEAYLGLNRFDDTKKTYVQLFPIDRPMAAQLMKALVDWSEGARTAPPQGVDPKSLEDFQSWIRERRDLAAQTGEVSAADPW